MFFGWFQVWNHWKRFKMSKKCWKRLKKSSLTSFWVRAATESWLKYTTPELNFFKLTVKFYLIFLFSPNILLCFYKNCSKIIKRIRRISQFSSIFVKIKIIFRWTFYIFTAFIKTTHASPSALFKQWKNEWHQMCGVVLLLRAKNYRQRSKKCDMAHW